MKSKSSLLWIMKASSRQTFLLIILSLANIISSTSYVGLALVSREAINVVTSGDLANFKPQLINCGLFALAIILAQLILTLLSSHLKAVISGRFEIDLRQRFFANITSKKYKNLKSYHSGELLNRFTSDIDTVVGGVTEFIPQLVSIVSKIASGLIVLAAFSTGFTVIIIAAGAAITLCATVISPLFKRMHKSVQQASGVMRGFTQECVENIVVVKSFSNKVPLLNQLIDYMKTLYKKKIHRNHVGNITHGGLFIVFTAGYYATLFWGVFQIAAGKMDYGTLMAFLQIVSNIRAPFFSASGLITRLYSALASAERLMEIEDLESEPVDNNFDAEKTYAEMNEIKVENLSFTYGDGDVIKDSTFGIKKGSFVSLTGASGSGKSTLFRLLLGLYDPNNGKITLVTKDFERTVDATTRSLFAYVPQGNLLLSGTVADNIKFGCENVTDEQLDKAAETACLKELIDSLPDGYNTVLGERGLGLSEGQVQRISIARALLSDAPILLLDECTSALDEPTELKLLENIAKLTTKTVIFISHRNAALSICDQHLRLEDSVIFNRVD
ncbi:MAG: ABC transporter ATP-binding protein [Ruminococcaceae bacterium]|nr:ABC transporter ATP-binding protein [Oscillospiraceae bacterium]